MSDSPDGWGGFLPDAAPGRAEAGPTGAAGTPRVVTSDALLRGDAQLAILHDQHLYFLRRTRYGKLILTK